MRKLLLVFGVLTAGALGAAGIARDAGATPLNAAGTTGHVAPGVTDIVEEVQYYHAPWRSRRDYHNAWRSRRDYHRPWRSRREHHGWRRSERERHHWRRSRLWY